MTTLDPTSDRADRARIFGIGLNKTGTSSLHEALTVLGFRSLHNGGPAIHDAVKAAIDDGRPLLSSLDQHYDAFSDIGLLSRRFRILDAQYPGSRFILTLRPVDDWIDSRRRHVQRNVALRDAGRYDGSFVVVDEDKWRREWDEHLDRVHSYFDGRDDFIELDIADSPRWEPICTLLDIAVPATPFPWANRDTRNVSQPARWIHDLRRRRRVKRA